MEKKKLKKRIMTFWLDGDLIEPLKIHAEAEDRSMAWVINLAIRKYLKSDDVISLED